MSTNDPNSQPETPAPSAEATADSPTSPQADSMQFSLPGEAKSLRDRGLWAGVLLLLTFVTYMPATNGTFIWDDDRHVSQNKNLTTPDGLVNIWTKFGFKNGGTPQYYPLTHTTYWLEYRAWQLEPFWYHITNIALHGIGAMLLWQILMKLNVPGAWLAAAIFALHPVQVESVAWISERKNVLAGALFFGSILAFLESNVGSKNESNKPRWDFYALSFALFCCALLSKTISCAMPAVMVLIFIWKDRRIDPKKVALLVPFFAVGLAMGLLTAALEKSQIGASGPEWASLTFSHRILIAGRAVWFYVGKLLWPANLAFSYQKWQIDPSDGKQWIFPIAAVIVLVGFVLGRKRWGDGPWVCALIFAGCLLPALGFFDVFPYRYSYVADHFQYLASTGLIVLFAATVAIVVSKFTSTMPEQKRDAWMTSLCALLLLALGGTSWVRAHVYKDSETIWKDTLAKNPNSWAGHNNYGAAILQRAVAMKLESAGVDDPQTRTAINDALKQSIEEFKTALATRPNDEFAEFNWGQALLELGQYKEAEEHYRKAISLRGEWPEPYKSLGQILIRLDRYDDALDVLRKVQPLDPTSSQIFAMMAVAYEKKKDIDQAIAMDLECLKLKSRFDVHYHVARLYREKGNSLEEVKHLNEVLRLKPDHAAAWASLGFISGEQGQFQAAAECFRRALTIDPNLPEAKAGIERLKLLKPVTRPATRSTTAPVPH